MVPENVESDSGSSGTSSSSSTSSTSSSTTSVASQRSHPAHERAAPVLAAHQRREESFTWGRFTFVFRPGEPKAAYHLVCRYHAKEGNTPCSKQISFLPRDRSDAVKRLKLWALSALDFDSKQAHQGGRGLPQLAEEQRSLTDAWLAEQEALLPAPLH